MGAFGVTAAAYEAAIRLIESGRVPLASMHTHDFALEDAERAIQMLAGEVPGEPSIHSCLRPRDCGRMSAGPRTPTELGVRVETVDAARAPLRVPFRTATRIRAARCTAASRASVIDVAAGLVGRAGARIGRGLEHAVVDLAVTYLAAAINEDVVGRGARAAPGQGAGVRRGRRADRRRQGRSRAGSSRIAPASREAPSGSCCRDPDAVLGAARRSCRASRASSPPRPSWRGSASGARTRRTAARSRAAVARRQTPTRRARCTAERSRR